MEGWRAAFLVGTCLTGVGAGLFGHATLTATMRAAPRDQIGLALGTWGAVQATCAGIGVALAGLLRDLIALYWDQTGMLVSTPYNVVFTIEIAFLALAMILAFQLDLTAQRTKRANGRTLLTKDPEQTPVEVS
jgi:BCD family chlorophyll transporter-like MFS transporter